MKIRIALLVIVFLGTAALIAKSSRPEITPIRESLSGLPMQLGIWNGQESSAMDDRVLSVLGVDDYINRVYYNRESFPAGLYIGYYQSQRSGDTIHSPLNCLPGAGWNPTRRDHVSVPVQGNTNIEINRIVISKGEEKQVVLYWYQSHGRAIASEYWGKIYTVLDAVRTNRTDAALVRIICPVTGLDAASEAFAETQAMEFASTLYPHLDRFLPE